MTNTNSWSIDQTRELFALCADARNHGRSLSQAFNTIAKKTGRSVNSVRNYYYAQSKTFELVPEVAAKLGIKAAKVKRAAFVPFKDGEVRELIEKALVGKAQGKSVRATIAELSGGNAKLALRLQNKYRSVLRSHRDIVEDIMNELTARGVEFRNPYQKVGVDNFARLTEYIAALDEKKVGKFLSIMEKL